MRIRVGQRLKVRRFKKLPSHWMESMKRNMGKMATIKEFNPSSEEEGSLSIKIDLDNQAWGWKGSDFESNNEWKGQPR